MNSRYPLPKHQYTHFIPMLFQWVQSHPLLPQLRHGQVLSTQLEVERAEQELKNQRALEEAQEVARIRQRQKESIIDELVGAVSVCMTMVAI